MTLAAILPVTGQITETETSVTENADGGITETTTTTTFTPQARTKVVEYFETYSSEPHGLPPAWVTNVKVNEIPATWRTARLEPGIVITKEERDLLIDAPADLVEILPDPAGDVDYYVAGSNVIAVDDSYRVVDSIRIPSVNIMVDE